MKHPAWDDVGNSLSREKSGRGRRVVVKRHVEEIWEVWADRRQGLSLGHWRSLARNSYSVFDFVRR